MNIKTQQPTAWQRCLDIVQHLCVIAAFILFLSYVQSVTATESELESVSHASIHR